MTPATVRLERFCGHAVYPVIDTDTFVSHPDTEPSPILNLELRCGPATEHTADPEDAHIHIEPSIDVWVPVPEASWEALVGTTAHVPWSYHSGYDAFNRFYGFEHEKMWDIQVEFLEHDGNRGRVRWSASTPDPNHDQDETRVARVEADAWFELGE